MQQGVRLRMSQQCLPLRVLMTGAPAPLSFPLTCLRMWLMWMSRYLRYWLHLSWGELEKYADTYHTHDTGPNINLFPCFWLRKACISDVCASMWEWLCHCWHIATYPHVFLWWSFTRKSQNTLLPTGRMCVLHTWPTSRPWCRTCVPNVAWSSNTCSTSGKRCVTITGLWRIYLHFWLACWEIS